MGVGNAVMAVKVFGLSSQHGAACFNIRRADPYAVGNVLAKPYGDATARIPACLVQVFVRAVLFIHARQRLPHHDIKKNYIHTLCRILYIKSSVNHHKQKKVVHVSRWQ